MLASRSMANGNKLTAQEVDIDSLHDKALFVKNTLAGTSINEGFTNHSLKGATVST